MGLEAEAVSPTAKQTAETNEGPSFTFLCVWHFHNISEMFPSRFCHQLLSHPSVCLSVRLSAAIEALLHHPLLLSLRATCWCRLSVFRRGLWSPRAASLYVRLCCGGGHLSVRLRPGPRSALLSRLSGIPGCNDYTDYNPVQIGRPVLFLWILLHTIQCSIVSIFSYVE